MCVFLTEVQKQFNGGKGAFQKRVLGQVHFHGQKKKSNLNVSLTAHAKINSKMRNRINCKTTLLAFLEHTHVLTHTRENLWNLGLAKSS